MASILIVVLEAIIVIVSCESYNVDFAARIAVKYFPTCSIITIIGSGKPSDIREVSDLYMSFIKYGKGYDVPLTSGHLIGLETMESINGSRDLHIFTPYCRVIITFAQGPSFKVSKFLGLLHPRENQISLRDIDRYIYLTDGKSSDDELKLAKSILLSDIGREVKYKVVAMSTLSDNKLLTYCLFCVHTVANPLGDNAVMSVKEDQNGDINVLFPNLAKNLHGHLLKVVGPSKYVSLYEMERINGSKWYEHKRGFFTEFFFIMHGKLNFSYLLRPCAGFGKIVAEGNTGTMLPNGTWAGCVGDIYNRQADLSMGGSPASDRMRYVEFSTNMRYDYVQFFTHGPKVVYPWTVVFVCFDLYGWACVLLSLIIGTFLLFKAEDILETAGPAITDILLYLYAYLLGQELCVEPRSVASKVTFVYWMFYGIVVGASYACSLQALIVSPGLSVVPTTMHELALASDWSCGVPLSFRNGLAENIFRKSSNPDMKKLYRETQEDKDAVECLRRSATEDYGCFHWQIMAEFYMGTLFIDKAGNHPFLYSKDYILFSGPTWMTRKREIWRDSFNDFFGRQFSMGIVYEASARDRRAVRRQLVQDEKDGKRTPLESFTNEDDGPRPYTLDNVKACFILLGLGLALSAIGFVHEAFPKGLAIRIKLLVRYFLWTCVRYKDRMK